MCFTRIYDRCVFVRPFEKGGNWVTINSFVEQIFVVVVYFRLNFVYSGNTFLPHFETKDIGCIEEKKAHI